MKIPGQQRKAISPIVATVLIIAATLIAAAAILGYVFGIFGGASNTANMSVVSSALTHVGKTGTATFSCALTSSTFLKSSNLTQISNTGSANGVVSSMVLTYGGTTYTLAAAAGDGGSTTCQVSAGSSLYVQLVGDLPAASSAGAAFNGYFTASNGAQVSFTGTFS